MNKIPLFILILVTVFAITQAKDEAKSKQPAKKKDLLDYSEAEIEKIYEEWEDNDDEKIPEDELPPHLRPPPKIDMSQLKDKPMDEIKKVSKKDRALMMFVTVSGNPTRDETEHITKLWQTSLFNANYESTRFIVEDDKAIFMIKDGSRAWEIKDFLVTQERCLEVDIDSEIFPGNFFKDQHAQKTKKSKKNIEF